MIVSNSRTELALMPPSTVAVAAEPEPGGLLGAGQVT